MKQENLIVFLLSGASLVSCKTSGDSDLHKNQSAHSPKKPVLASQNKDIGADSKDFPQSLTELKHSSQSSDQFADEAKINSTDNKQISIGTLADKQDKNQEADEIVSNVVNADSNSSDDECKPLRITGMPQWFPNEKVFLTRVSKPCITSKGNSGAELNSQWVAMGVACSGGENRFRWLENYLDPKQVSFDFGISCPMSLSWSDVSQSISSKTGLVGSKMIAYNPMAVVYWELEETGERDVGELVKIKNVADLKPHWRAFVMKGQPLKFKLVGYESAWTELRQYFEIRAEIFLAARNKFKLVVKSAKQLNTKDIAAFQNQCEQIVPRRDCDRVF